MQAQKRPRQPKKGWVEHRHKKIPDENFTGFSSSPKRIELRNANQPNKKSEKIARTCKEARNKQLTATMRQPAPLLMIRAPIPAIVCIGNGS